jgi:hypothetical protein
MYNKSRSVRLDENMTKREVKISNSPNYPNYIMYYIVLFCIYHSQFILGHRFDVEIHTIVLLQKSTQQCDGFHVQRIYVLQSLFYLSLLKY